VDDKIVLFINGMEIKMHNNIFRFLIFFFAMLFLLPSIPLAQVSNPKKTISGDEAVKLIKNGTSISNMIVNGDINLSGSDLIHPVIIINSTIGGCLIVNKDDKTRTIIRENFNIFHSTINECAQFNYVTFMGEVNFTKVIFQGGSSFSSSSFNKNTKFVISEFHGMAFFTPSVFNEIAYFLDCTFSKNVSFVGTIFNSNVFFIASNFEGNAIFQKTLFNKLLDLSGTTFNQRLVFWDSIFHKICFINIILNKELTSIEWKQVDNKVVSQYLNMNGNDYDSEKIIEKSYTSKSEDVKYEYLILYDIFKSTGKYDDADKAYYMSKIIERTLIKSRLERLKSWFLDVTYGYGTKPWNAIKVGIIIMLFFSFLYMFENAISSDHEKHKKRKTLFRRLSSSIYFSANTFTTIGTGDYYPNGIFRFISMVEGFLGYIVMALFLVTMANQLLR
jgi:hypothetical protein